MARGAPGLICAGGEFSLRLSRAKNKFACPHALLAHVDRIIASKRLPAGEGYSVPALNEAQAFGSIRVSANVRSSGPSSTKEPLALPGLPS